MTTTTHSPVDAKSSSIIHDGFVMFPKVTRVELIDENGRLVITQCGTDVYAMVQDNGRTLKLCLQKN